MIGFSIGASAIGSAGENASPLVRHMRLYFEAGIFDAQLLSTGIFSPHLAANGSFNAAATARAVFDAGAATPAVFDKNAVLSVTNDF